MSMRLPVRLLCALMLGLAAVPALAADLRLMMVEQAGCIYCARWNEEVAPEYPLTDEGRAAPLFRQDLRAPLPDGVKLDRPPVYTPTFVLLRDGVETGRIEGYPGEDFFWPLLAKLISDAQSAE